MTCEQESPTPPDGPDGGCTPNWYVLVFGLGLPTGTLTLAPGLSLIPLPGPLSIFDLAAAGAAGFSAWALVGQVAPSCTCEIESARDSDVMPGYDTLHRAWLASSLLVLRGFGTAMPVACSAYPWSTVADTRKQQSEWFIAALRDRGLSETRYGKQGSLQPFRGELLDFHTVILRPRDSRRDAPNAEDAAWCRNHFDRFNQLCSASERFRFALEAAIDWRYSKDQRTAIARLWSGVEALFAINAELVYRLSVYSASLLHPRGPDRSRAFTETKGLYAIRSKAVHGEPLKQAQLDVGTDGSFGLLRALLLKCIERGAVPNDADMNRVVLE